jgi:hypothetical protein
LLPRIFLEASRGLEESTVWYALRPCCPARRAGFIFWRDGSLTWAILDLDDHGQAGRSGIRLPDRPETALFTMVTLRIRADGFVDPCIPTLAAKPPSGPDGCKLGLKGIVSKRRDAPYKSGPSRDWIKVKNPDSPAMRRARAGTW